MKKPTKRAPARKPMDDRAKARRVIERVVCGRGWIYLDSTRPDPIGQIVEALIDANLIRGEES